MCKEQEAARGGTGTRARAWHLLTGVVEALRKQTCVCAGVAAPLQVLQPRMNAPRAAPLPPASPPVVSTRKTTRGVGYLSPNHLPTAKGRGCDLMLTATV